MSRATEPKPRKINTGKQDKNITDRKRKGPASPTTGAESSKKKPPPPQQYSPETGTFLGDTQMEDLSEEGPPTFIDEIEVDSEDLDGLIRQCETRLQQYPGNQGFEYRLNMLKNARQARV